MAVLRFELEWNARGGGVTDGCARVSYVEPCLPGSARSTAGGRGGALEVPAPGRARQTRLVHRLAGPPCARLTGRVCLAPPGPQPVDVAALWTCPHLAEPGKHGSCNRLAGPLCARLCSRVRLLREWFPPPSHATTSKAPPPTPVCPYLTPTPSSCPTAPTTPTPSSPTLHRSTRGMRRRSRRRALLLSSSWRAPWTRSSSASWSTSHWASSGASTCSLGPATTGAMARGSPANWACSGTPCAPTVLAKAPARPTYGKCGKCSKSTGMLISTATRRTRATLPPRSSSMACSAWARRVRWVGLSPKPSRPSTRWPSRWSASTCRVANRSTAGTRSGRASGPRVPTPSGRSSTVRCCGTRGRPGARSRCWTSACAPRGRCPPWPTRCRPGSSRVTTLVPSCDRDPASPTRAPGATCWSWPGAADTQGRRCWRAAAPTGPGLDSSRFTSPRRWRPTCRRVCRRP